ncbi:MAG: YncE family protein [Flavobacteriales bacterium]|nr:MAG: YncE family protein [Flavobacteriales bacterium]
MKKLKNLIYLLIVFLFISSCSSDDETLPAPLGEYENGILITNEGPFQNGTGTITYISENYETIEQQIFNQVNSSDLGNIVQSIGFSDDIAFIVVNNSNKIEVVNRYSFESLGSITEGLMNPRYFTSTGINGYVTNWGDPLVDTDDYIAVIDLLSNTVTSTIPVAFGPEKLILMNDVLYVAHQGGYGQNNILSVIDTSNNTLASTIEVGDVPNSMVALNNDLWVLCGGNPEYTGNETNGKLVKIDVSDNSVVQVFDFLTTDHPKHLSVDLSHLIYNLNGAVFSKDAADDSLPQESVISGSYYAMTAKEGKLYATDAGDFASNGALKIFDLSTNSEILSVQTGIIPGGVYFND